MATFRDAYKCRGKPSSLLFHGDQGTQYTAYYYRRMLRRYEVTQSFSRPGTPFDNAIAESFFASLKKEELHRRVYNTYEELDTSVQEYINFYNYDRPHQRMGYRTPIQVEEAYYDQIKS